MWDTSRENLALIATFSLAVAIGTFILWGPTTRRKKKGEIAGLVNLGYTCFLNTLLQAFASCPIVMEWLVKQDLYKKNSLSSSLTATLQVLNGKEEGEDPFTPTSLIQALLVQGWVISPGEQDAHELFHVIVTTLEEETQKPLAKVCSLIDAVDVDIEPREVHSEILHQESQPRPLRATVSCLDTNNSLRDYKLKTPLPFHGLFTSQLQCMKCKHKSAVHYATFYSLSLVLPPQKTSFTAVVEFFTLQELIRNYVTNRVVNNVTCDGCGCPDTDQIKSLNFGKLPSCLCIHIARTTWEGEPLKRDDYIDFPEFLNMEPYTYNNIHMKQLALNELAKGDQNMTNGSISLSSSGNSYKHLYQLTAVVVHKGTLSYGHFITYRRGVGSSYNSWYCTSDAEVRETTIHEVMQASAYMLFYMKFTSAVPPVAVF